MASRSDRVVLIAQRVFYGGAETEFYGHVELDRDGELGFVVGPGWSDPEEAIAWGRAHADVVLIRVGPLPQQYYSAGDVFPTGEGSNEIRHSSRFVVTRERIQRQGLGVSFRTLAQSMDERSSGA